jgi:hypothetical protein
MDPQDLPFCLHEHGTHGGTGASVCGPGINQLDVRYLQGLAQQLGVTGELQLQDMGVYNLCGTKGAYVSFLNLASVQALSKFAGQEIALSRFRMNSWMKGLEPFEELTWVDKFPGTIEILAHLGPSIQPPQW